jgi:alpha-beta hydrolase superfamily lysophospholipase
LVTVAMTSPFRRQLRAPIVRVARRESCGSGARRRWQPPRPRQAPPLLLPEPANCGGRHRFARNGSPALGLSRAPRSRSLSPKWRRRRPAMARSYGPDPALAAHAVGRREWSELVPSAASAHYGLTTPRTGAAGVHPRICRVSQPSTVTETVRGASPSRVQSPPPLGSANCGG